MAGTVKHDIITSDIHANKGCVSSYTFKKLHKPIVTEIILSKIQLAEV